ncbi:uncharacterized protein SCHCODRAFT_02156424 [Schizophyllum commune H4-8]|uniref:uncharacterized protein n=1 Tax=Schizophyllum commune (strain H4-8 / FGSC 9210) TaxID=578458 RepID=UPI002160049B|nr:uncharacterized protein SCHCODRAFT_02156424 [Schizophyllum commune H4-8]KAI5898116.1 hypothetical protein SCHCODRAFT_02156424 [Schizophyllum commune H4-8]
MAVPEHEFTNPDTASLCEATDSLIQLIKARKSNGPRNTSAETKLRQRIDDILKKKPLAELLEPVPTNHQGAYTPLHPRKWAVVVRSLRTYSALSDPSLVSRSRRVWQTIEKYWTHAWAWVDYLHHRPNVDSVRLVIHLFMSLSENIENRRAEVVDLLHAEPNSIVLLIDVWFRIPEYMFQIRGNLALVPLAKAVAAVYCESDSVEIRAIVERELSRRVQGSGHRLFRHVARLLRILLTLSDKEEDGGVLASLELSSQLLVDRTHSLHPSVLPRDMINVCVALVRRHAGQPYEVVAQAACFFLEQAWTLTADLRPIIWSLQEGLLPNILCMKQPKLRKGDPMVLLKQLQPALSHRRVLRTFWHAYQRDKLSIEKAPWHPKILDDLIERAEKHWAIFEKLQKEWDATTTHCHNPDCPLPALDIYQCPCKTAYYCSRECQRQNWKDDHRTKCHFFRWDLIEETKVPLPHRTVLSLSRRRLSTQRLLSPLQLAGHRLPNPDQQGLHGRPPERGLRGSEETRPDPDEDVQPDCGLGARRAEVLGWRRAVFYTAEDGGLADGAEYGERVHVGDAAGGDVGIERFGG